MQHTVCLILVCIRSSAAGRSAEEVLNCGPIEPPVKDLVQGAYSQTWMDMNLARQVRGLLAAQPTLL